MQEDKSRFAHCGSLNLDKKRNILTFVVVRIGLMCIAMVWNDSSVSCGPLRLDSLVLPELHTEGNGLKSQEHGRTRNDGVVVISDAAAIDCAFPYRQSSHHSLLWRPSPHVTSFSVQGVDGLFLGPPRLAHRLRKYGALLLLRVSNVGGCTEWLVLPPRVPSEKPYTNTANAVQKHTFTTQVFRSPDVSGPIFGISHDIIGATDDYDRLVEEERPYRNHLVHAQLERPTVAKPLVGVESFPHLLIGNTLLSPDIPFLQSLRTK